MPRASPSTPDCRSSSEPSSIHSGTVAGSRRCSAKVGHRQPSRRRPCRALANPSHPKHVSEHRFIPTLSGGPFDGSQLPPQAGSPPQCYVFSAGDLERWRAVDERPRGAPAYGDAYLLTALSAAEKPLYEYLPPVREGRQTTLTR